jgi:hypothetical protein
MAAVIPDESPYRIVKMLKSIESDRLVELDHGKRYSRERYSRGPGYLISAGGVKPSFFTFNVIRPTVLFLKDGASHLDETVHVKGPGKRWYRWNNTGVFKRFAVCKGPVHIPSSWEPSSENGNWKFFPRGDMAIVTYSTSTLGIIYLPEDKDIHMKEIIAMNKEEELEFQFNTPEGKIIRYDLNPGRRSYIK